MIPAISRGLRPSAKLVQVLDPVRKKHPAHNASHTFERKGGVEEMLRYALIFLVIAIIAGILGFGAVAGAAAGIAKILFGVFLVLFLVGLIMHLSRGGTAV